MPGSGSTHYSHMVKWDLLVGSFVLLLREARDLKDSLVMGTMRIRSFSLIALLLGPIFFGLSCAPTQPPSTGLSEAGIHVVGKGKVDIAPDLVHLSLGVEVTKETVQLAREQAARAMEGILGVLHSFGLTGHDIRTSVLAVQPEYHWDQSVRKQEITGYRVTNSIVATIRDLEILGIIIDGVMEASGDHTRIRDITFAVENPELAYAQARDVASRDARAKAQHFATLMDVELGKPYFLSETSSAPPVSRSDDYFRSSSEIAGIPVTPINPGELEVIVQISAKFAIK